MKLTGMTMNKRNTSSRLASIAVTFLLVCSTQPVSAGEADPVDGPILEAILHSFLAGASNNDPMTHERFWSEQLVYTSSGGKRFGKAEIMAGLENADDEAAAIYSAEDIQIQQFGDVAVVAFRLVASPLASGNDSLQYFNTGTFFKEQGLWKAVAWQATRIPGDEQENDS